MKEGLLSRLIHQ